LSERYDDDDDPPQMEYDDGVKDVAVVEEDAVETVVDGCE
jgi:hypothetical protein